MNERNLIGIWVISVFLVLYALSGLVDFPQYLHLGKKVVDFLRGVQPERAEIAVFAILALLLPLDIRSPPQKRLQQITSTMFSVVCGVGLALTCFSLFLNLDAFGIPELRISPIFFKNLPSASAFAALGMSTYVLSIIKKVPSASDSTRVTSINTLAVFIALASIVANLLDFQTLYAVARYDQLFMSTPFAIGIVAFVVALQSIVTVAHSDPRNPGVREGRQIFLLGASMILAVGLCIGLTALWTFESKSQQDAVTKLQDTLTNRNALFEAVLQEALMQAKLVASSSAIQRNLSNLDSNINETQVLERLKTDIGRFHAQGFSSIRLVDSTGTVIHALGTATLNPVRVIDLQSDFPSQLIWDNGYLLKARFAVQGASDRKIGTIDMEKRLTFLNASGNRQNGLGPSFDMLVCGTVTGEQVGCFPSLLNRHILLLAPPAQRAKLPIDFALEGRTGVRTAVDYRKQAVVAAYAPIGAFGIGAVAKIDSEDLYAPIRTLLENLAIIGAVLFALGALLLRNRIDPLVKRLLLAGETAKAATAMAVDRESRIRAVVDNVSDGIVTMTMQGVIQSLNAAGANIFGRTPEDLVGLPFEDMLSEQSRGAVNDFFHSRETSSSNSLGRKTILLTAVRYPHATEVFFELGINRVVVKGENLFIGILHDLTRSHLDKKAMEKSQETLKEITNNVPVLIGYVDRFERYQFVNHLYESWFSKPQSEIIGRNARELFGREAYAIVAPHIARVLQGETVTFSATSLAPNYPKFAEVKYLPKRDSDDKVEGYYVMGVDLSSQKEAEIALEAEHSLLTAVLETVDVGVVACDANGTLSLFNRASRDFHNLPEKQLPSDQWENYYSLFHSDGLTPMEMEDVPLFRTLRGDHVKDVEMAIRSPEGGMRFMSASGKKMTSIDGRSTGAVIAMSDVTAIRAAREQLKKLAQIDALTGLPNRYYLNEKLHGAINRADASGELIAVMFLDIDKFKAINDTHGHRAGDLVLQEFGQRVQNLLRNTDTVARLGGDEFVILLGGLGRREAATAVAQKIINAMMPKFEFDGIALQVSSSIGITFKLAEQDSVEKMLGRADTALYAAKTAGRNAYRVA